MARKPTPPTKMDLKTAVSALYGNLEQLGCELQEWAENMPENMQGSDKHDAATDAGDTLTNLSEPDVPSGSEIEVSMKFGNTKYMSKVARLAECENLRSEILSQVEDKITELDPNADNEDELVASLKELHEELEQLESEIDLNWS
jgi:hypothetical protein